MTARDKQRGRRITGPAAQAVRELLDALQREAYANGTWQPDTAVELMMAWFDAHGFVLPRASAPSVRVHDGSLVCPVCGAHDQIAAVDRAVRTMTLEIIDGRLRATAPGGEFQHVRLMCEACDATVDLGNREIDYNA